MVKGAIESARATAGLMMVAVVPRMHAVRQHACDGATDTQHGPMGSAAATTAITSTPIRNLTTPSSADPVFIAMRAINPPCDGNHALS
jgi:hypothetical protein